MAVSRGAKLAEISIRFHSVILEIAVELTAKKYDITVRAVFLILSNCIKRRIMNHPNCTNLYSRYAPPPLLLIKTTNGSRRFRKIQLTLEIDRIDHAVK